MKYLVPAGRLLFSFIFILSATGHFKPETIAFAASQGVPFASISVPLSGVIELLGGLSILLGYKAKWGAWLLVIFLIPVTFTLHRFWLIQDPMMKQLDMAAFMKNISMLGAALLITYFGSGLLSVDEWLRRKSSRPAHIAGVPAGI
jgi:putative oxidoreductase